jgi:H+-transporting ATPase
LIAVFGTQAVATLIAVYGLFMTPLGWKWAAFVWGYAVFWFLINDRLKLIAYKVLDATKSGKAAAPKPRKMTPAKNPGNIPQPAATPPAA